MNVTSISSLTGAYKTGAIYPGDARDPAKVGFDSMLNSAMQLLESTNSLQKNAEKEEIAFALGESDNTHDLMIAEQKANIALSYTVAVRDRVIEAYNTIMNIQM